MQISLSDENNKEGGKKGVKGWMWRLKGRQNPQLAGAGFETPLSLTATQSVIPRCRFPLGTRY